MSSQAPMLLPLLQAATDSVATHLLVERSWLDTAVGIAQSLVSVLMLVFLIMGVAFLYSLRQGIDQLTKLVKSSQEPLKQVLSEARAVTGEVQAIARGLQAPITLAGETLSDASTRAQHVMDRVEGRLERLDALVDIAQEEAESAVVSAASLLRGARAGGEVLRQTLGLARGKRRKRRHPRSPRQAHHRNGADGATRHSAREDDHADHEGPRIGPRRTSAH